MKQTNRNSRDDSADASAYAAAAHGSQARADGAAFQQAAPIYQETHEEIANNLKGGAGYFAEAHHAASFNVGAQYADANVRADRLGSHAFGSTDIRLDSGEAYNPKYYASADGSYRAGAELVEDSSEIHAKYAGQTILVPSDQLDAARDLHHEHIESALSSGDTARAHALESIKFDDHIHSGGAESLPLTYEEAHQGADDIRHGALPEYAGEDTGLFGTGAEGALLAAAIALATSIGPSLLQDAGNVVRGKLTPEQATQRLKGAILSAQLRSQLGWAASRGAGAAALTFIGVVDPMGAAFLVNIAVDAMQLANKVKRGEMTAAQFGEAMKPKVIDRGAYAALAAGAFWLVGPVGLLIPIVIRRTVTDLDMQKEALKAWESTASAMRDEFRSRMKTVDLLTTIDQHYRNAQANAKAKANERSAKQIADDLSKVQKLLGFNGGSPDPAPV